MIVKVKDMIDILRKCEPDTEISVKMIVDFNKKSEKIQVGDLKNIFYVDGNILDIDVNCDEDELAVYAEDIEYTREAGFINTVFKEMGNSVTSVFDYFEIEESKRDMNIISEIYEDYWYISGGCLHYTKYDDGFKTGECYSTEGDCDDAVYGQWEKDEYVAIKIGCGEHKSSELWVFRKDKMVDPE